MAIPRAPARAAPCDRLVARPREAGGGAEATRPQGHLREFPSDSLVLRLSSV